MDKVCFNNLVKKSCRIDQCCRLRMILRSVDPAIPVEQEGKDDIPATITLQEPEPISVYPILGIKYIVWGYNVKYTIGNQASEHTGIFFY